MAGEPVLGWDGRLLVFNEATFGTLVAPVATQALEYIECDMGVAEVGDVRPQKDRTQGRGMTQKFVEGRVKPISFSLSTTIKSRAANTTVPMESALYQAAGFVQTVGGASVSYALSSNPTTKSIGVYRSLGTGATCYEAETALGGVIKSLTIEGGDEELLMKASGAFAKKFAIGYIDSVTFAAAGTSTFTASAPEEVHRLDAGYYLIESEVIQIANRSDINYSTGVVSNIVRGALSTAAAAHAAKPLAPYQPTLTLAGSPISEGGTCTFTLDSVALSVEKWSWDFTTGFDHRPLETGSKYAQGMVTKRYDSKLKATLLLNREHVALLGKATQRRLVALTIVQSTGSAGGIFTLALPFLEVESMKVPDPPNDVSVVELSLRARDSSATNDMVSITLT